MAGNLEFTVSTKASKLPLLELGPFGKRLVFDGVELPVRAGCRVEPDGVTKGLPETVRIIADCGLKILFPGRENYVFCEVPEGDGSGDVRPRNRTRGTVGGVDDLAQKGTYTVGDVRDQLGMTEGGRRWM